MSANLDFLDNYRRIRERFAAPRPRKYVLRLPPPPTPPPRPPVEGVPHAMWVAAHIDNQLYDHRRDHPEHFARPSRGAALEVIALKYGVKVADIKGPRRFAKIMMARREACYALRVKHGMSFVHIGSMLNIDHSTAVHAVQKHCSTVGIPSPATK